MNALLFLRKLVTFSFQVWAESRKIDWFSRNDLFGAVLRILLIVGIASMVFLGIDWLISWLIRAFLRI